MDHERDTLTLIAGGDVSATQEPVDRMAELIAPTLKQADFRFAQCERTYSVRGSWPDWQTIPSGKWSRMDPAFASLFRASGIDVVSVASNHALDWGYEPLEDTVEMFRSWGMAVVGGGRDGAEARTPAILEKNGVRVAILAYCSVLRDGQAAGPGHPGIAAVRARTWYEPVDFQPGTPPRVMSEAIQSDVEAMQDDIRAAREQADAVVVSLHWGVRFVPKILATYQVPVAHAAIDAGADVIVGHHPHTMKPIEVYKGKVCFYSIGNFMATGNLNDSLPAHALWNIYWYDRHWDEESLYSMPAHCRHALLPYLQFDRAGIKEVSAIPIVMNRLAQPSAVPPETEEFDEVLATMEWLSDQMPHRFRRDKDRIVIEAP